jgi:hypothetical protein
MELKASPGGTGIPDCVIGQGCPVYQFVIPQYLMGQNTKHNPEW